MHRVPGPISQPHDVSIISDNSIHHQEQGDGDREPGAGRGQQGQDQGRQHGRLEGGAAVRAATSPDQP